MPEPTPASRDADVPHESAHLSEPFSSILEEIASELELRPLLTSIITRACGLLGADDGAIGLYVPVATSVQIEAIHRLPRDRARHRVRAGRRPGRPRARDRQAGHPRPLRRSRPHLAARAQRQRRHRRADPRPGRRPVGVFGIGARPPRKFGQSDLDTLRLFARHAAIAIQNALRYGREQRRTERMTLIARIARVITSGLEPRRAGRDRGAGDSRSSGLSATSSSRCCIEARRTICCFARTPARTGTFSSSRYRMPVTKGITGAAVRTARGADRQRRAQGSALRAAADADQRAHRARRADHARRRSVRLHQPRRAEAVRRGRRREHPDHRGSPGRGDQECAADFAKRGKRR